MLNHSTVFYFIISTLIFLVWCETFEKCDFQNEKWETNPCGQATDEHSCESTCKKAAAMTSKPKPRCAVNENGKRLTFENVKTGWQEKLLEFLVPCINETKVDPVLAENIIPQGEFVDNYPLKCFALCILQKFHMVDKDGKVDAEIYTKMVDIDNQEIIKRAKLEQCYSINIEDKCEAAFRYGQCVNLSIGRAIAEFALECEL